MSCQRPEKGITTITFDFWNTLYSAGEGSLQAVRPGRQAALRRLLTSCAIEVGDEALTEAYELGFQAYLGAWHQGIQFGAPEQVRFMLAHFAVSPGALDEELALETATAIEDASRTAALELIPGARETIPALAAAGYRLGIISDTSLTPGRIMKEFLARDGLLDSFSAFTFSDITGFTKPDRRMFELTLAALGAEPERSAHVGDTPRTDIAGARALGMTAIRCAAAVDHEEPPAADFVIRDHGELRGILGLAPDGDDATSGSRT